MEVIGETRRVLTLWLAVSTAGNGYNLADQPQRASIIPCPEKSQSYRRDWCRFLQALVLVVHS
jgi:hypothetical protein